MSLSLEAALRAYAARQSNDFQCITGHEPTLWLRGRLLDLDARWRTGAFTTCEHLRPGVHGVTALWHPDLVTCGPCARTFRLTGEADRTCDRCGVVTDTAAGIHPEIMAFGNVAVAFGLCRECHRKELGR